MTDAAIAPLARFKTGGTSVGFPAVTAGGIRLAAPRPCRTFMPWPDATGDLTWEGREFGIAGASTGANVTSVSATVTHRVSDPAAFSAVEAQMWAGGSPLGAPAAFTPSASYVTETVATRAGADPTALPGLSVRLTFRQKAMGLAYVSRARASASWSYPDAIGVDTISTSSEVASGPGLAWVAPPRAWLAAAGTVATTLSPALAQATVPGQLCLAWAFSNSPGSSGDITCTDPSWTLLGSAGQAFGWSALYSKIAKRAGEAAPSFTASGGVNRSQLLQFGGAQALDQFAVAFNNAGPAVSVSAPGADTASGDLTVVTGIWSGSNPGPSVITIAGTDSAGTALPLALVTNDAGSDTVLCGVAWGQASRAAGPGRTAVTASNSIFDFGSAYLATFKAVPTPLARGPGGGALAGRLI